MEVGLTGFRTRKMENLLRKREVRGRGTPKHSRRLIERKVQGKVVAHSDFVFGV